ncbi:GHMP kinase [Oleiharenicola sp. Vm1]|uniref:GHMP family kinase ATP-binding protein n=1 Tax=Oleiharenicola sp. Vm1 TaxID=3398393 RepID=UPI0039F483B8
MIISRAPLRVSFFGGGTDFPEYFRTEGGAVLATAIDKFSYVTASPFQSSLFDYAVRVSYSKGELVRAIDEIQHPVFRECLRLLGLERDIELHTVADLPAFTGLGSSSTFTVSLLDALHRFRGEAVPPLQLAHEAVHIERNVLKESVGFQDQTTAAVGGFNVIEFSGEADIQVHPLNLSAARLAELESHLLVVYTGLKRRAAEIESRKLKSLELNRGSLRAMRAMVDRGRDLLVDGGSLAAFGGLLHESWLAKRALDAAVSNTTIDELYTRAREAGAWGGKVLGAGGGGFLLLVAPPERHAALRRAFADSYQLDFRLNAPGAQLVFGNGGCLPPRAVERTDA